MPNCPYLESLQPLHGRNAVVPDLSSHVEVTDRLLRAAESIKDPIYKDRFETISRILLGMSPDADKYKDADQGWGLKCICLGAKKDKSYINFLDEPYDFIGNTIVNPSFRFCLYVRRVYRPELASITAFFNEYDQDDASTKALLRDVFKSRSQEYSYGAYLKVARGWNEAATYLQEDDGLMAEKGRDGNTLATLARKEMLSRVEVAYFKERNEDRTGLPEKDKVFSEVWIVPMAAIKRPLNSEDKSLLPSIESILSSKGRSMYDMNMVVYSSDDNTENRPIFLEWRNKIRQKIGEALSPDRISALERCMFFLASEKQRESTNVIPESEDTQDGKDCRKYGEDSIEFLRKLRCLNDISSEEILKSIFVRMLIVREMVQSGRQETEQSYQHLSTARDALKQTMSDEKGAADCLDAVQKILCLAAEIQRVGMLKGSKQKKEFFSAEFMLQATDTLRFAKVLTEKRKCSEIEEVLKDLKEAIKTKRIPKTKGAPYLQNLARNLVFECAPILQEFNQAESERKRKRGVLLTEAQSLVEMAARCEPDALHDVERVIDEAVWNMIMKPAR